MKILLILLLLCGAGGFGYMWTTGGAQYYIYVVPELTAKSRGGVGEAMNLEQMNAYLAQFPPGAKEHALRACEAQYPQYVENKQVTGSRVTGGEGSFLTSSNVDTMCAFIFDAGLKPY